MKTVYCLLLGVFLCAQSNVFYKEIHIYFHNILRVQDLRKVPSQDVRAGGPGQVSWLAMQKSGFPPRLRIRYSSMRTARRRLGLALMFDAYSSRLLGVDISYILFDVNESNAIGGTVRDSISDHIRLSNSGGNPAPGLPPYLRCTRSQENSVVYWWLQRD